MVRRPGRDGGQAQPCGWLKDKYGLSWQISHPDLEKLVSDPDPAKVERMMQAMFKMTRLEVRQQQDAADGK